ncbi:MAG: hypothetical protein JW809_02870 [Pirellulales bacterium]|nr:hypothetical protein [Pirellulales bacterium]
MNDIPRDELLSAYLDGELSPEETLRAERLLAADPAARQCLDELRAVGDALRALPTLTLGENLSDRVLQAAERRMLAAPLPKTPPVVPAGRTWQAVARRLLNPRALAWSGTIVAVALLVMLLQPETEKGQPGKDVARRPEGRAAAPAIEPSIGPDGDEMRLTADKAPAEEKLAEEKLAEERSSLSATVAHDTNRAAGLAPNKSEPVEPPSAPALAESESAAPAEPATTTPASPVAPPRGPASADVVAAEPPALRAGPDDFDDRHVVGKAGPAPGDAAKGAGVMGGMGGGLQYKGAPPPGAAGYGFAQGMASQQAGQSVETVQPVLVVECDVKKEQAENLRARVDEILLRNNIAPQDPPPPEATAAARSSRAAAAEQTDAPEPMPAKPGPSVHAYNAIPTPAQEFQSRQDNVKQVLVEATWDQVHGALDELSSQSDLVTNFATQTPPALRGRVPVAFDAYNRRGLGQVQLGTSAKSRGGEPVEHGANAKTGDVPSSLNKSVEADHLAQQAPKAELSRAQRQRQVQQGLARWYNGLAPDVVVDETEFGVQQTLLPPAPGSAATPPNLPAQSSPAGQTHWDFDDAFGQQAAPQAAPAEVPPSAQPDSGAEGVQRQPAQQQQPAQQESVEPNYQSAPRQLAAELSRPKPDEMARYQVLVLFRLVPPLTASPPAAASRVAPAADASGQPAPPPAPRVEPPSSPAPEK